MKIVILGAAGQISRKLTDALLSQTEHDLVLFGRNLKSRLVVTDSDRVRLVEGVFEDQAALKEAIEGADLVYLNAMEDLSHTRAVVDAMQSTGVKRLIGASMAGIENEVPSPLVDWTRANLPSSYIQGEKESADLVKASDLDYTLLRLTWLYDEAGSTNYELVPSGQEFKDAEVSREAVVAAILEILADQSNRFNRTTFGVGEPETHYPKPSFY